MELVATKSLPERTRARKYDFTAVFDQLLMSPDSAACYKRGEDFDSSLASFKQVVYAKAREEGLKASVWTDEDAETITFIVRYRQSDDESDEQE